MFEPVAGVHRNVSFVRQINNAAVIDVEIGDVPARTAQVRDEALRDGIAVSQPMTPVLPTERIAHLSHGTRLLRCRIFGAWADARTACGGRVVARSASSVVRSQSQ